MEKTSNNIRKMFLSFFKEKEHTIISGNSLIPHNDSTLLFTNAGMNQFKDIFLGKHKYKHSKVVTIQKCLRTGGKHNDLNNVGYTNHHHTFFEMLGNFSFGDYFKKEAIIYAWELLTSKKWFNLNPSRLWVTVYFKDQETYNIWTNIIKLPKDRVVYIKDKNNSHYNSDNFWQMGDTGPCGPSTEIFYDTTENFLTNSKKKLINNQNEQVEIWNIVFMEYNRMSNGKLTLLPKPSVDTGMGLERIARILQNKKSNYDIDIFQIIIKSITQLNSNININNKKSIHIIADHIRSSAFLISENILPSNEGRGYVLRRIIRRALRYAYTNGMNTLFFYKLIPALIKSMDIEANSIKNKQIEIQNILKQEEIQFNRTLNRGLQLLKSEINHTKNHILNGKTVFKLYDTYGFPADLTSDFCKEQNIQINHQEFVHEMKKQQQKARKTHVFKNEYNYIENYCIKSTFCGYNQHEVHAIIKQIFIDGKVTSNIQHNKIGIIILDQTTFFPESGGQSGDIGQIIYQNNIFHVQDTQKYGNSIGHIGKLHSGTLNINQLVLAKINRKNRILIQNNHTATHLLHATLRNIFGINTTQHGSHINSQSLRFDFSCQNKITSSIIKEIEKSINSNITKNIPIITKTDTLLNAKKNGAIALFNERYDDVVRIITIQNCSIELCKGTHSNRTGDLGLFKIIDASNIGSGIKRISAVTGEHAIQIIHNQEKILHNITTILNTNESTITENIKKLIEQKTVLINKINELNEEKIIHTAQKLIKHTIKIKNINLIVGTVQNIKSIQLRKIADNIKSKLHKYIIIITSIINKKIYFIISIKHDLSHIIPANFIAKKFIEKIGGNGGGKANLAEGGGSTKLELLTSSIEDIKTLIKQSL
ncbi:MAG: alanine--tRNA ligase [Buchnera aphidicola (Eriosoma harunire)]